MRRIRVRTALEAALPLATLLAATTAAPGCRRPAPAADDAAPEARLPAAADSTPPNDAAEATAAETDGAADAPAAGAAIVTVGTAPPPPGTDATDSIVGVRRLTEPSLGAHRPRFGPDGRRVVFFAGEDGSADVWVVNSDGTGLARLTDDPADDRDPTWNRKGDGIVWSSNRKGSYDLWTMRADGSGETRFTDIEGDEMEPAVSPIRYDFYAVATDDCSEDGTIGHRVDDYDKAAFTRRYGGRTEVWFQSLNVRHGGRVSPVGSECHGPAWSGNGLGLTWTCDDARGSVVFHSDARWDQDFRAALEAVHFDEDATPRCNIGDEPEEVWQDDECLAGLPRRYAVHEGQARSRPADRLEDSAYSANQILLVAAAPGPGGGLRSRGRWEEDWSAVPGGPGTARRPDWSPDGAKLAFESDHEGGPAVYVARTDFYLQEVRDLVDFPELWGPGRSARLHRNRFLAREGDQKEFFKIYERVRYARRSPFVTADAALQAFHDEFTRLLRESEQDARTTLHRLCKGLFDHYVAKLRDGGNEHDRYLAVLFGVPFAFLEAVSKAEPSFPEMFEESDPEYLAAFSPVAEQLPALLEGVLRRLPGAVRPAITDYARAALGHSGFVEIQPPDREEPVTVDFTQFQIRGHYRTSELAGYFVAVMWFGLVPLPLDSSAFDLVDLLDSTAPPGDGSDPGDPPGDAPRTTGDGGPETLGDLWNRVDALVGALLGRPVDVGIVHLRRVRSEHAGWLDPFDKEKVVAALLELRGPMPFHGVDGVLSGEPPPPRLTFLPQRYGLDAEFFSRLTGPTLDGRGRARAFDVMASLGIDRARQLALAAEEGEEYFEAYRDALATLAGETAGRPAGYWSADIYHSWIAVLAALAGPIRVPAGSGLLFAGTEAWSDRMLSSSLAGYAQLKHDAVLYAKQEYGGECDSEEPFFVFVEQPVLPEPSGFVDPVPGFFRALSRLAERIYRDIGGGRPPAVEFWSRWLRDDVETNAGEFAADLADLAEKELAGRPFTEREENWLRGVDGLLESLFLETTGESGPVGADEGRTRQGVALVADVYTHLGLQAQEALELAIGRISDFYVVVPDAPGQRLTQGGIHSYYEFYQPIEDRLTDEAWNGHIEDGLAPAAPSWTQSFLEPRPAGAPPPPPASPER